MGSWWSVEEGKTISDPNHLYPVQAYGNKNTRSNVAHIHHETVIAVEIGIVVKMSAYIPPVGCTKIQDAILE
jgi:hypothetical protein